MGAWFVTGTDTGCGKTAVSVALVKALSAHGSACGYKPVAAGCELMDGQWRNEDGLALQAVSQPQPLYEQVNPYALAPAIAPHIAAEQEGMGLSLDEIQRGFDGLKESYQNVVVEGAGGWRVPLCLRRDLWFSDIPAALQIPVIVVVGVKLGCINHATLTVDNILASGQRVVGWVANTVEADMPVEQDNIQTLQSLLTQQRGIPQIAQFAYQSPADLPPEAFDLAPLLSH